MNINLSKALLIGLSIACLFSCTPKKLTYRLGPELSAAPELVRVAPRLNIEVVDLRPETEIKQSEEISVTGPEDEANVLKKQIINRLQANGFKLISDHLLADLTLRFEIEQLAVNAKSSLLKAELRAESQLRLKASNKGHQLDKLYKTSRTQEVAIPVNESDVSGLINQLLSSQLTSILSDSELIKLAEQQTSQTIDTFTIEK